MLTKHKHYKHIFLLDFEKCVAWEIIDDKFVNFYVDIIDFFMNFIFVHIVVKIFWANTALTKIDLWGKFASLRSGWFITNSLEIFLGLVHTRCAKSRLSHGSRDRVVKAKVNRIS